eukprot:JP445986.1.p1 GENE.JP445986.1~~JP445986.1.p1  ORF type:complete len:672 (-),score=171.35 JP445986.1:179-2194(-)
MASLSKLASNPLGAATTTSVLVLAIYLALGRDKKERTPENPLFAKAAAREKRVAVDGVFLKRFSRLFKILFPTLFCAETGYAAMVAASMIARTFCDLWQISNGTSIERAIIARKPELFGKYISRFVMMMLPIALINNLLKYGLWRMSLGFRKRLTNYLYKEYLTGYTYYKVGNLDNRISNADQLLTQDVERFCTSVSDLYSNVSKPLLDIAIYARQLTRAVGPQGPTFMLCYLVVSGALLTRLRRPLGRFTVTEQQLEGHFRFVNSRLITHSEEIAFYNGKDREKMVVESTFQALVRHLSRAMNFRFSVGIVDTIIAKYLATVVGYYVVSRPFLDKNNTRHDNSTHGEIMEDYYRSGRMLLGMATAVGRLVLSGRELNRLAGFTARVTELITVLKDLNNGRYTRTMVTGKPEDNAVPLVPNSGKLITADHVVHFDKVPLVTPNCDVLVKELSFKIESGMNLLVSGPNGCGKSSLFRILGELWPMFGGTLTKPAQQHLFYIPQKPYLALGTLRDQVIYPDTKEQCYAKGTTDKDLLGLLSQVHLQYLVDREGGWDAISDWADVLSGGEKQRVAMARLFYHKPQFAILDECTSAVSVDVEGFMYTHSRTLGITLVTVSHRKTLWQYHEHILQFDGRGGYEFREMTEEEKQSAISMQEAHSAPSHPSMSKKGKK